MKEIIKVNVSARKVSMEECETDLLCIGQFSDSKTIDKQIKQLDEKMGGAIQQVIKLGDFKGEAGSTALIYTGGKIAAMRILLVGLGDRKKVNLNSLRNSSSAAAKKAVALNAKKIAVTLHLMLGAKKDLVRCGQVIAEGIHFGSYIYDEFVTAKKDDREINPVAK